MKKMVLIFMLFCIGSTLFAFDRSLIGSWGLVIPGGEKEEFVRFGQDEIRIMNLLFRARDFERAANTIFIEDFDGDSVVIQYHLLSQNSLLFILWNLDDFTESLTLILTKF